MPKKQGSRAPGLTQAPRSLATTEEVAAYLRKPPKTLANWRSQGIGPAYLKTGTDVRYDWDDVLAWVKEQRHDTISDIGQTA